MVSPIIASDGSSKTPKSVDLHVIIDIQADIPPGFVRNFDGTIVKLLQPHQSLPEDSNDFVVRDNQGSWQSAQYLKDVRNQLRRQRFLSQDPAFRPKTTSEETNIVYFDSSL